MSVIFFSLDVGLSEVETADETSIPPPENESDVGGVFMVEVVLTEAADRGDFRAEADCRFDGSKTQDLEMDTMSTNSCIFFDFNG